MQKILRQVPTHLLYEKTREELYFLAFVDLLTGVYNRNMLEEMREKFDSKAISVAIVDIDNLKEVNDTKGHLEGDEVIKSIARKLESFSEFVFRLGGDEFLLINPTSKVLDLQGASCGCTRKPSNVTLYEAMKEADLKMYQIKKARQMERFSRWKI
jgi:GGDEF domain-containing protein